MLGGGLDCGAGQSTAQTEPGQPYQPQNQPSSAASLSRTMMAAPFCVGSRWAGSNLSQAAAGAEYISLMMIAPSRTGAGFFGAGPELGAVDLEPMIEVGRIPDQHRRMRAVIDAGPLAIGVGGGPRAGVADVLVDLPAAFFVAVAQLVHERAERLLIIVERQAAGIAHLAFEHGAELGVGRIVDLRRRLLLGTGRRSLSRKTDGKTEANRQRRDRGRHARIQVPHCAPLLPRRHRPRQRRVPSMKYHVQYLIPQPEISTRPGAK